MGNFIMFYLLKDLLRKHSKFGAKMFVYNRLDSTIDLIICIKLPLEYKKKPSTCVII